MSNFVDWLCKSCLTANKYLVFSFFLYYNNTKYTFLINLLYTRKRKNIKRLKSEDQYIGEECFYNNELLDAD